jgi:hypothetical protein
MRVHDQQMEHVRKRLTVRVVAAAAGVLLVGGVAGCSQALTANTGSAQNTAVGSSTPRSATSPASPGSSASATTSTAPTQAATTPAASGHPGTALGALATLPVRTAASMSGYSRAQFGAAWSDNNAEPDGHNGCDTRNDILRRDLVDLVVKAGTSGCTVASGVLHDPYGGTAISFVRGADSAVIQIDHVVALGDAWTTGAATMTATERIDLSEDPLELLAASGKLNDEKGDADAAGWLPPDRASDCSYVARQVAVKAKWHLWVTASERAAMVRVLDTCPSQRLPADGATPLAAAAPTARTTPTARPTPTTRPTPRPTATAVAPKPSPTAAYVHPGAFCSPASAHGYTDTGKYEVCGTTANSPTRNRWHSAG